MQVCSLEQFQLQKKKKQKQPKAINKGKGKLLFNGMRYRKTRSMSWEDAHNTQPTKN